jgi:tryptophan-rich sensory protein
MVMWLFIVIAVFLSVIASFLTMTKNRMAYYQHISKPFFSSFSLFSPAKLGWDLANDGKKKPQ